MLTRLVVQYSRSVNLNRHVKSEHLLHAFYDYLSHTIHHKNSLLVLCLLQVPLFRYIYIFKLLLTA